MRKNFRTYNIAVEFYQRSRTLQLPRHLNQQLERAASSIVLNLAEGAGRQSKKDSLRFFHIAFGSLRECQAVLDLAPTMNSEAGACADKLAAHLYRLIHTAG